MNDADIFFGPAPTVEMPTAQRTDFGRYPARIRRVADAFVQEMGWNLDPTTKRDIAAGAKKFVDVHGEDPALVKRTIQHLKRNAPHIYENIASPGSLYKIARSLKRKPEGDSDEARQRYVWEVDDE